MLGRKGCKWSYDERILFDNEDSATFAYDSLVKELLSLKDYESGNIVLELEMLHENIPSLRLKESPDSNHIVRFITDGNRIGVNVRYKKPKQFHVYVPIDESL